MLEIMKDSRVGAIGAAAGAFSLLLRFALLTETSAGLRVVALLLAPALGRMAITLVAGLWPSARPEGGLGSSFARHVGRGRVAGALLLGLGLALLLPLLAGLAPGGALPAQGPALRALAAWAAAPGAALLLARSLAARLGGLTGDSYGAANELAEVAALACFAALPGGWAQ